MACVIRIISKMSMQIEELIQMEAELSYDLFCVRLALQDDPKELRTTPGGLRLENIEKYLQWILAFVMFFTEMYMSKQKYTKPGILKWAAIIKAVGSLGLRLMGLKKVISKPLN